MTIKDWRNDMEAVLMRTENRNLEPLKQLNRDEAGERVCECCEDYHPDAALTSCRTQYADDSLNVDPFLCPRCTAAHHEHWDARWADYHSSRGVV